MELHFTEILPLAAEYIERGEIEKGKDLIRTYYPFKAKVKNFNPMKADFQRIENRLKIDSVFQPTSQLSIEKTKRGSISFKTQHLIFSESKYRCRYTNIKLINPAALMLMALIFSDVLPCHSYYHCPLDKTHVAIWTHFISIDHKIPLCRGGRESLDNYIPASSTVNMVKIGLSMDELKWIIYPIDGNDKWDGLCSWFVRMTSRYPNLIKECLEKPECHQIFKIKSPRDWFAKWSRVLLENS